MTYSYKFLPDVALADIAYRVHADCWAELFTGAAEALTGVMVNPEGIEAAVSHPVAVEEESLGEALHAFLSEIVYLKDAQSFLVSRMDLRVNDGTPVKVVGTLFGDTIDRARHTLGQDVKAITYHMFEVGRDDRGCIAQVVLDI